MRRRVLLCCLTVLVVGSCTGASEKPVRSPVLTSAPPGSPWVAPRAAADSGRSTIAPFVAPMRLRGLRWASGNVPRHVPEPHESLPSLLDDPPEQALAASYVPRANAPGFSIEAIDFYSLDGRWVRLSLGDLDLPQAGWYGGDTYGAGALSPDGRWWAGPMQGGFYVVDMRDGSVRVGDPVRRRYGVGGLASFTWSPDSDEMVVIVSGDASRVSVPGLTRTAFPRPEAYPALRSDGGWVECPPVRRVVTKCTTYSRDGTRETVRDIPADLQAPHAGPTDMVDGSVWYSLGGIYGNHRRDWEITRTDDRFRAVDRLVLPARSRINGVSPALGTTTVQLAALGDRLLLAYLSETQEIVRLLRPGRIGPYEEVGMDFWEVSFARDLLRIG